MGLSDAFKKLKLRRSSRSEHPPPAASKTSSEKPPVAPAAAAGDQTKDAGSSLAKEPVGASSPGRGPSNVASTGAAAPGSFATDEQNSQATAAQKITGGQRNKQGVAGAAAGMADPTKNPPTSTTPASPPSKTASRQDGKHSPKDLPPTPPTGSSVNNKHKNAPSQSTGPYDADGFPVTPDKRTSSNGVSAGDRKLKDLSAPTSSSKRDSAAAARDSSTHGSPSLPVIDKTPALSTEVAQGLVNRSVDSRMSRDPESMGYATSLSQLSRGDNAIRSGSGSSSSSSPWQDSTQPPVEEVHNLTQPPHLLPVPVPDHDQILEENRRFVTEQSMPPNKSSTLASTDPKTTVTPGDISSTSTTTSSSPLGPNLAYVATRTYSFNPSPPDLTEDEHKGHLMKHLGLLQNKIFNPASQRAWSVTPPGKVLPLQTGPPVPTVQRDQTLTAQRKALIGQIVQQESADEKAGLRGPKLRDAVDPRLVDQFSRAGWKDRIGVQDTIDVKTRVLDPVIQVSLGIPRAFCFRCLV